MHQATFSPAQPAPSTSVGAVASQTFDPAEHRWPRHPLLALRALRRLIADPERTEDVFVIIEHLAGDALARGYARFAKVPGRLALLDHSLLEALNDRDALRALPAESLGRAYLAFVETEQLSADGLVEASEGSERIDHDGMRRYGDRTRDMHDLWHVVTGYGRDTFGEACLLAFTQAQAENLGIAVIAVVGTLKIAKESGRVGVLRAAWQGYRAGRRASWLPAEHWEALLREPLTDVRTRLKVAPPTRYLELRAQLKAA